MKKLAMLAAVLSIATATALPASAEPGAPICLQSYRIDRTTVVDQKTILFRMKDGKVWRSNLNTPCPGLRFNGFVYVTSFDEICGGLQSIRVLQTGAVCMLGRFTPEPSAHS